MVNASDSGLPPFGAQPRRVVKDLSFTTSNGHGPEEGAKETGNGEEGDEEKDDEDDSDNEEESMDIVKVKVKGRKPKIGDYTGTTKLVLLRTATDYKAYLVVVDFFPSHEAALIWALDSFNRSLVWYQNRYPTLEFPSIPYTLEFESIVSDTSSLVQKVMVYRFTDHGSCVSATRCLP